MADGSPTSGGSGDLIQTADTFADTNSGTSGTKVAVGGVRLVDVLGHDLGNVQVGNEMPVRDERLLDGLTEQLKNLQELLHGMAMVLDGTLGTKIVSGRAVRRSTVSATTSSTKLLDFAKGRLGWMAFLDTSNSGNLFGAYGSDPATISAGGNSFRITPGGLYVSELWAPELAVNGIWDSATSGFVNLTEIW